MWTLAWLAIFSAIFSVSMAEETMKMSSSELVDFNIGDYQGCVFESHFSKHVENADIVPAAVSNKSVDVIIGDLAMVYRMPRLSQAPAQNVSFLSYQITRMMAEGDNCQNFDFNLD